MLSKVNYVSMIRLAHNVIDLLVQNLLDMDHNYGSFICNISSASRHIITALGKATEFVLTSGLIIKFFDRL